MDAHFDDILLTFSTQPYRVLEQRAKIDTTVATTLEQLAEGDELDAASLALKKFNLLLSVNRTNARINEEQRALQEAIAANQPQPESESTDSDDFLDKDG